MSYGPFKIKPSPEPRTRLCLYIPPLHVANVMVILATWGMGEIKDMTTEQFTDDKRMDLEHTALVLHFGTSVTVLAPDELAVLKLYGTVYNCRSGERAKAND